jgi:hypothetical protein
VHVFTDRNADDTFHGMVQDFELAYVNSIAFCLPPAAWPLPLYELALITAERVSSMNAEPRLMFAAPNRSRWRRSAAGLVRGSQVCSRRGIALRAWGGRARPGGPFAGRGRESSLRWTDRDAAEGVGPAIRGLPAGRGFFVLVDGRCVVRDTGGRSFAAADVTEWEIKHGGLGAQQADTAAAGVAEELGAYLESLEPIGGVAPKR